MTVPYIFGTQGSPTGVSIAAAELDANFAAVLSLSGGGAVVTPFSLTDATYTWTYYSIGNGELGLTVNSPNNVLTLKNTNANAYSAMALQDKTGFEQGAFGYSQAGGSGNIVPGFVFLEVSGFDGGPRLPNGFALLQTGLYHAVSANWTRLDLGNTADADLSLWCVKGPNDGTNQRIKITGDTGFVLVGDQVSAARLAADSALNIFDAGSSLFRLTQTGVHTAIFKMSSTGLTVHDQDSSLDIATFRMDGSGRFEVVHDLQVDGGAFLSGVLTIGANQVVAGRNTGWAAMTGSADKATVYATGSVTLAQLAGRMMALQAALTTHGLIGT